ncbi:MAG TPA: hypothetical protein VJP80_00075 [Candidatus Saccharimonadales bacterium]|nr:hypothetical protein [Candidatus Saccharimonadales bacterium]
MRSLLWCPVFVTLLAIGFLSCSNAQSVTENNCRKPQFGIAEKGFVNCKPQDAFARLKELAKKDDPKALYMLGNIYDYGGSAFGLPDVKPDSHLAMQYFERSAKGGYAEAQSVLAWYYWRDYGETRQKEAIFWACSAAMQNYPNAVAGIRLQIKVARTKQTVAQYCAPILKSLPHTEDEIPSAATHAP